MRRYVRLCTLLCNVTTACLAAEWGSIAVETGSSDSDRKVTFENSQMKVVYSHFYETTDQHAIKELYVKYYATNLAGSYVDACANRPMLTDASAVYEDSHMLMARLTWGTHTTADISIYKDKPFIKIAQTGNSPNIVDISNGGGNYVIHGSELWIRGFVEYEQCYYNKNDAHCTEVNGSGPDGDPGPLLYDGWFIVGLYHSDTRIGWGRVMPQSVEILKLLPWGGKGFEWFWNAQTGYLFVVTNGEDEILTLGKQIADWANGGEDPDDLTAVGRFRPDMTPRRHFFVHQYDPSTVTVRFDEAHSFRVFATDGSVVYSGARPCGETHCIALPGLGSRVYVVAARTADGPWTATFVTLKE